MQYQEFLQQVQERTGADSPQKAETLTRAVLGTLGERLDPGVRDRLTAQLPSGLKPMFEQYPRGNLFDVQDFYRRVGARADLGYQDSVAQTRAVIQVLENAVSIGQMEEVLAELPHQYRDLLNSQAAPPGFPSMNAKNQETENH